VVVDRRSQVCAEVCVESPWKLQVHLFIGNDLRNYRTLTAPLHAQSSAQARLGIGNGSVRGDRFSPSPIRRSWSSLPSPSGVGLIRNKISSTGVLHRVDELLRYLCLCRGRIGQHTSLLHPSFCRSLGWGFARLRVQIWMSDLKMSYVLHLIRRRLLCCYS